jgi:cytochrome P450
VTDLVDSYAIRIPITIICELFGIPEEDREQFRLWALKLVGAGQDPEEVADASRKVTEYANSLINAKRANPGDDMVSELVRVTEDGDRLTQGELVAMIFVLVVAGHITTIYSIASSVHSLLTHPDQLAKLKADPSLMPAAVDELLRFDGAAGVGTFRFTRENISVGDMVIPAGNLLALSWHAANRDSSHFPDADRLDLDRHPLGSMAFGHGLHYCIGVPLAKMQIEIALSRLTTRFPDLRLAVDPGELRWDDSALLRGLLALPVKLGPQRLTLQMRWCRQARWCGQPGGTLSPYVVDGPPTTLFRNVRNLRDALSSRPGQNAHTGHVGAVAPCSWAIGAT